MIKTINEKEIDHLFKFSRTLGTGTFATVKLAKQIEDGSECAVKIVKRSSLSKDDEKALKLEIQLLQNLHHPNIIGIKEPVCCSHNFVYMPMELMSGGELFDRIVLKDHYSEVEAKNALFEIVTALKYCHDNNIVHRDLKPENILYSSADENATLKLADFGLAYLLKPNELMHLACGTPGYVAPEVLRGLMYGKEVDMWSVGVILYILLCGFPPFYDDNNQKLFAAIIAAKYSFPDPYWADVSKDAKELVSQLIVTDPHKRLTAEQVLLHPWMKSCSDKHLVHFSESLKAFNSRRKFRAAIHAVQISNLLQKKWHSEPVNKNMTADQIKSIVQAVYQEHHEDSAALNIEPHFDNNNDDNNNDTLPETIPDDTVLTKVENTSKKHSPIIEN